MPSPVGHALGGLAGGWLAGGRRPRSAWARQAVLFAAIGMLPDIDLLFGAHSGPTHSVGAALIVGLFAWLLLKGWQAKMGTVPISSAPAQKWGLSPFSLAALSVVAAYGTHILLDFLGNDTSVPYGVMALWPFSHEYFMSPVPVFPAITRRYWLAGFWEQNLRALLFELAVLGPIVIGVSWWRRQPRDLP